MHMNDKRQDSACITLTASKWAADMHVCPYVSTCTYGTHRNKRDWTSAMQEKGNLSLSLSYPQDGRSALNSLHCRSLVRSSHITTQHHMHMQHLSIPSHPHPHPHLSLCVSALHRFIHVCINHWHAPLPRSQNRLIGKEEDRHAGRQGWMDARMYVCVYVCMVRCSLVTRPLWSGRSFLA